MGNTLVKPGVLRDTPEYPHTKEGSIIVGRNRINNNGSHHYQQYSSRNTAPPSTPLGGLKGLLTTQSSTIGARFRRSYFRQFVFVIGLLSLIIFLQDSMLSPSAMREDEGKVTPVIVVGSEQDLQGGRKGELREWGGEYSRVKTVTTFTAQDSILRKQQQQQKKQSLSLPSPPQQQQELSQEEKEERLQEVERLLRDDEEEVDEWSTKAVVAVLETPLSEDGAVKSARFNNINSSNDRVRGTKETTMQWMKTFANLLIGHGPPDLDEEETLMQGQEDGVMGGDELAVFIPQIKQQGQDAEIASLPTVVAVMDVLGQDSIPEYQVLSNPIPQPSPPQAQELPLHTEYQWTTDSIQKALDPIQEALSSSSFPPPRPQDKVDKMSKLEIVQWQQEQDLTECRGQKDFYEHDIENLQHVIDEQESDLRDLRAQVEALKAQAAAFEAELE